MQKNLDKFGLIWTQVDITGHHIRKSPYLCSGSKKIMPDAAYNIYIRARSGASLSPKRFFDIVKYNTSRKPSQHVIFALTTRRRHHNETSERFPFAVLLGRDTCLLTEETTKMRLILEPHHGGDLLDALAAVAKADLCRTHDFIAN